MRLLRENRMVKQRTSKQIRHDISRALFLILRSANETYTYGIVSTSDWICTNNCQWLQTEELQCYSNSPTNKTQAMQGYMHTCSRPSTIPIDGREAGLPNQQKMRHNICGEFGIKIPSPSPTNAPTGCEINHSIYQRYSKPRIAIL